MKGIAARTIALLTLALIVLVFLAYQAYVSFKGGGEQFSYYDCVNLIQAKCLIQAPCDENDKDCTACKDIIGCKDCCQSDDDCCKKVLQIE